ncbi:MAG: basic amino acid ABC transporter substrate-binding protein [Sphaerochaetaceae bacterium]|nr:basic amino acid ABC transporter substrate-binding protein [Sphaerochaetaceae bacterium]NLY08169.1 basic amino acid ABC transporter substrate-binding protein [Spirochaetales bacterium]
MKKTATVLVILAMAVSFIFAGGSSESYKEKTEYVFAANCTWPPFEMIDDNGDVTGFEMELVQRLGEISGKKFIIRNVAWDTIFAGLSNGQYDAIASGVTVTEERKATIDFADPFCNIGQIVVIRKKSADSISGIKDLTKKKVGVQMGTTGDFAMDDYDVVKAQYEDVGLAILDLVNGNVDAVVCDSVVAADFVLTNENFKSILTTAGEPFTTEDIAICVKKGNSELLKLINDAQAKMVESGEMAELKAKWNII